MMKESEKTATATGVGIPVAKMEAQIKEADSKPSETKGVVPVNMKESKMAATTKTTGTLANPAIQEMEAQISEADNKPSAGMKGMVHVLGDVMEDLMEDVVKMEERDAADGSRPTPFALPLLRRGDAPVPVPPGAFRGELGGNLERMVRPDFGILAANADNSPLELSVHMDHDTSATSPVRSVTDEQDQNEQLAQAYAVQEEHTDRTDLERADPIDLQATTSPDQQRQQNNKQRHHCFIAMILSLLLAIAGIIVGVVVGTNKKSKNNPDLVGVLSTGASPTVFANSQPTDVPSSAPTGSLDSLLDTLPTTSVARINSGSDTPQWKAWNWLANHQNVTFLPEWRKTQLFVLATFFYSFEGESWYEPVHDKWMDETKDECFWFSQGFGYFWDETYYEWEKEFQVNPCNNHGQFTVLWLSQLHMSGLSPTIPPEIALLTSLSNLGFGTGDIEMPLSGMLPLDNLHEMSSLTELWLDTNQLEGPIPSQLGELTALTELWLNLNLLSGTLPSELGDLSALIEFRLSDNQVSGQIPSELGRMIGLTDMRLNNNQLTGTLPSELGLLTSLSLLDLRDNCLTGTIPTELTASMGFQLFGNKFTGVVPDHLCSFLRCDCGTSTTEATLVSTCEDLVQAPPEWPGRFPTTSDAVMLNILTDGFPEQTSWVWQRQSNKVTGVWETLESRGPMAFPHYLYSALLPVSPSSTYRAVVFDSRNGGFFGNGWITLTGNNQSVLHAAGKEAFSEVIMEISLKADASFDITNSSLR